MLLTVLLIGCQDQIALNRARHPNEGRIIETKTAEDSLFIRPINDRVVYLAETDFKAWAQIVGLEDRLNACDITESLARSMTTEALVESFVHYPLNYIILFYNHPELAVETIAQNSALHKELLSREDAADRLFDKYVRARPVGSRDGLLSKDSMMIEDDLFLGYFIDYYKLPEKLKQEGTDSLKTTMNEKGKYVQEYLAPFCDLLFGPMAQISMQIGFLSNSVVRSGGAFLGYYQIRTPLFQPLEGILRSEWSDDSIAYYDSVALANHPNAIMYAHSSAKYNCHSYAWYQNSTSNQVWLNSSSLQTSGFQLSKYWTADLYESCLSVNGEKVYYPNGDHSAIVLSNGNFLSKWGDGPLMQHAPEDCDYLSTTLQYYREKNLPIEDSPVITGPNFILPNVSNNYVIGCFLNSYIQNYVTAESYDPDSSFSFNQIGTDTYSLVCNDYGAYLITVNSYATYNGITYPYAYNSLLVICVGTLTRQRIIDRGIKDEEEILRFLENNKERLSE